MGAAAMTLHEQAWAGSAQGDAAGITASPGRYWACSIMEWAASRLLLATAEAILEVTHEW